MKILLTAPTPKELPDFDEFKNIDLSCVVTGAGGAATMYFLQKELNKQPYDLVIQGGICGSFDITTHPLNKVYAINKDIFGDVGAQGDVQFLSLVEMGFLKPEEQHIFTEEWLINDSFFPGGEIELPQSAGMTIHTLLNKKISSDVLYKRNAAELESMEGAYFHYLCLMQKQPFLQVRAVSNEVGERDKTKWSMLPAIKALHGELYNILENINNS